MYIDFHYSASDPSDVIHYSTAEAIILSLGAG